MVSQLDLLVVRPGDKKNIYGDLSLTLAAIEPPLWAGLIAGFVRHHGFRVDLIDAEAENWNTLETAENIVDRQPMLTVIVVTGSNLSASTWKMHGAGALARQLKNRAFHGKILFWGLHPSALPERTLEEEPVDFVCRGEGFHTLVLLLEALKSDDLVNARMIPGLCFNEGRKVVIRSHGPIIEDLNTLPMTAWDLMPMEKYRAHNWHCFDDIDRRQPYGVIYTSLGCPFSCSFCALKTLFGVAGIRYRKPKRVVEEIDFLVKNYRIRNIKILDECFTIKNSHVEQICDRLIDRGYDLNIWAYARIDTVDEKLMEKMRRAGVRWLCYGIESGSDRILKKISKGRYHKAEIRQVIDWTRSSGIHILANFMFGLADDDHKTMRETLDFAKELQCEYTNLYTTMAYPGSQLFTDTVRNKVKLPESWLGYSQFSEETLPVSTKYLSGSEVLRFRDNAFIEFHQDPKYLTMIENRFGDRIAGHIREVTQHRLKRKHLGKE